MKWRLLPYMSDNLEPVQFTVGYISNLCSILTNEDGCNGTELSVNPTRVQHPAHTNQTRTH